MSSTARTINEYCEKEARIALLNLQNEVLLRQLREAELRREHIILQIQDNQRKLSLALVEAKKIKPIPF